MELSIIEAPAPAAAPTATASAATAPSSAHPSAHVSPLPAAAAPAARRPPHRGHWTLIVRNLLRERQRNLMLGLLMAFASFVVVFFSQLLAGIAQNFTHNLVSLASGNVYVSSTVERAVDRNLFDREYGFFSLPPAFYQALAKLPGYRAANPRIEFDAQLITARDTIPWRVAAFDAAAEPALAANFDFVAGRPFTAGRFGIALPEDFARRHGIRVGDPVRLLARSVGKQVNLIEFAVSGTFRTTQLSAWLDGYAYVDLASARQLLDSPDVATRLNVQLADRTDEAAFAAALDRLLAQYRQPGRPALDATPWTAGASFFVELTQSMTAGYLIVMVIIAILLGAGLGFTTVMVIVERRKEIATLAALGATPRQLRRLLVGENLVLAAAAALAGVALGALAFAIAAAIGIPVGMAELQGFLGSSRLYPAFEPAGFVAGALLPPLVAAAASSVFARRAARLPIAEAMADR